MTPKSSAAPKEDDNSLFSDTKQPTIAANQKVRYISKCLYTIYLEYELNTFIRRYVRRYVISPFCLARAVVVLNAIYNNNNMLLVDLFSYLKLLSK